MGTSPLGPCESVRSSIHFSKKRAICMFQHMVGVKIRASPVHPRRSSRCGQSVGTLCMFEPANVKAIVILRDQNRDYLIEAITRQVEEQD